MCSSTVSQTNQHECDGELYRPFPCKVESVGDLTSSEKLFRLVRQDGQPFGHKPGQFMQVSVTGIGEAPISVSSSPTRGDYLELGIRRTGTLTNATHKWKNGDVIGLRGPFGTFFDTEAMKGKDVLLISGGCGLAPMRALIQHIEDCRDDFGKVTTLYGAKDPSDLLYKDELAQWQKSEAVRCQVTVDDVPAGQSWDGNVGLITTLIPPLEIDVAKTFNVGIVGLGWVAGAHIETFKDVDGAEVVAVCSRRKLDPAALEAQHGRPMTVYNEYAHMLADPRIDVIDICTPHPLHPAQAIAAAKAGKHLIIEKPIAIDWADALRMRRAIKRAGVLACVCFECRFSAQFQMTRSLIDRGLLGQVHYGEVDYYHGIGPWYAQYAWNVKKAMGGSALLTAGVHALDGLLMFMDGKVAEVATYGTKSNAKDFRPYEYATTSVTLVKFDDGRIGKVTSCIDCLQPYYFHVHLVGSEGSLLDNRFTSRKLRGLKKDVWSTLQTALVDSGDVSDHPYQPQFQAFVDAIRRGKPMPWTDFDTAFETHRAAFAADRSAAEGRPIKLSWLSTT